MMSAAALLRSAKALGWTVFGPFPDALRGVGTDTRSDLAGRLFIALRGDHFDGHDFVEAAVDAGAAGLLVGRLQAPHIARAYPDCLVVGVEDTLYAMGELARSCRAQDPRSLVAITGSAGKTSARMALVAAAKTAGIIVHSPPGNENNRIGVPRFLLNLPQLVEAEELIVVECGTSEPGEIARLGAICAPDLALITGICAAHTELLIDEDGVAHEKADLLRSPWRRSGLAIHPIDARLAAAAEQGGRRSLAAIARDDHPAWLGAPAHLRANAAKVLAALQGLGIKATEAVVGAACIVPVGGRGEVVTIGSWAVMDDTYNANEASMRAALDAAAAAATAGQRPLICFLGEMRELGTHSATAHRQVARYAAAAGAKSLYFAGPYAAMAAAEAEAAGVLQVSSGADAADLLDQIDALPSDAFILVKGSRGARMERIIAALEESA
jgi:UDP-N-acetylmuramoyl-tripeptide--D-alanyl-D-alanine ligase